MFRIKLFKLLSFSLIVSFISCDKKFSSDDYVAYFGGEIINPTSKYVLFCKDSKVIDTIYLNSDNTFFKTFDSLTPGMYSFKNEPEYQYVYFDKNDSLMVRVNTHEFDESVVFCGRGEEKNNFFMELYLKNEEDKAKMFNVYDLDVEQFCKNIDSSYASKMKYFESKKQKIQWNDDFDLFAKSTLDFYHYSKKELYPLIHKLRIGVDVAHNLPKDFYEFRNTVDFNNPLLINFSPFVRYLTNMMNNVAFENNYHDVSNLEKSLELNVKKLLIADSIFTNIPLKNIVLNNIAFTYLLEDQNLINNKKFLDKYHELSTDNSQQNEISKISSAIQYLKPGNTLPSVELIGTNGEITTIEKIISRKTVIFFWSKSLETHVKASHKKVLELKNKYPDYDFLAICVDDNQDRWKSMLGKINHMGIKEYRAVDFDKLREKWIVNKIHRTMIVDHDTTIINAFVGLFDVNFQNNL